MEKFRWNFVGSPIFFKSTPDSWQRDIAKAKKMLGLDEVEIEHNYGNTTNNSNESTTGGVSDTSTPSQPTLSKRAKKNPAVESETIQLPTVSGDVDDVSHESDVLATPDDREHIGSPGDWFDSQRV